MKNRLQYAYSITVFIGVLSTAYLMMNNEGNAHAPFRALQAPTSDLRMDAQVADPAVVQLFEIEKSLVKMRKDTGEQAKRVPTDAKPKILVPVIR